MALYKTTFFFKYDCNGWSLSLLNEQASSVNAYFRAILMARAIMPLLGVGVEITHIRTSDVAIRGDNLLRETLYKTVDPAVPAAQQVKAGQAGIPAAQPSPPDPNWTAIMLDLEGNDDIHGRVFLRGVPDIGIRNPSPTNFSPQWRDAYLLFIAEVLTGTHNWRVRGVQEPDGPLRLRVSRVARDAARFADTVATIPAGDLPLVGDAVRLGGVDPSFKLNGLYRVMSVSGRDVSLFHKKERPPRPVIPSPFAYLSIRQRAAVPIRRITFEKATRRKVGRPFGLYRGRSKLLAR